MASRGGHKTTSDGTDYNSREKVKQNQSDRSSYFVTNALTDSDPLCRVCHRQVQAEDSSGGALPGGQPSPCQAPAFPLLPAGHPCQPPSPLHPTCPASRIYLGSLAALHSLGQDCHQQVQLNQPQAVPVHPHRHLHPPHLPHTLQPAPHHPCFLH